MSESFTRKSRITRPELSYLDPRTLLSAGLTPSIRGSEVRDLAPGALAVNASALPSKGNVQAAATAQAARATGKLQAPLDRMQQTSPFGWRDAPGEPNDHRLHEGGDYAADIGTRVKAADGGNVVFAGPDAGYGNAVVISHGDGWYTRYAHLSRIEVSKGQTVEQGQRIGRSGDTGVPGQPHLHFEIRKGGLYGQPLNPEMYLGKKYRQLGVILEANPTLRSGDGGDRRHAVAAVQQLQSTLKDLGFNLEVDGEFGPATERAVKTFQRRHDMKPDGVVGAKTWKALAEALDRDDSGSGNDADDDDEGGTDASIAWGGEVSQKFKEKVIDIADDLGIRPSYLMAVMAFETGESFSPRKENPSSHAIGLIQFLPGTAEDLGTSVDALKKMSAVEQLDYVDKYLSQYEDDLRDHHDLADVYMAVFTPSAIGKDSGATLYRRGQAGYEQNSGLDADKDGRITKAEAAQPVREELEKGQQPSHRG
ncbi:MAG TPA: peptidoglycan DD-metalloendopeptidase family protein [Isosphaeraceae bacterium]|jgi:hypothetical protein